MPACLPSSGGLIPGEGGDPDLCLGEGLGEGGSLEWGRWTQLSAARPLPQLCTWGRASPLHSPIYSWAALLGRMGRWVVGPSTNKGKAVCVRTTHTHTLNNPPSLEPFSPKPGGGTGQACTFPAASYSRGSCLGPQTVKCQLQLPEPGWPDLSVPAPSHGALQLPIWEGGAVMPS